MKLLLLAFFIPLFAQATTFRPVAMEVQLREADGLFIGHFLRQKSIELEDGRLATQMIFKMVKENGLDSELFGMDEVIVHFPGGKLDGRVSQVEGVPEFHGGEKVVVLIKSVQNRYWGLNLGYGSYRLVNYGKEQVLVNTLFPNLPEVGQMPLADFETKLRDLKRVTLKDVYSPHLEEQSSARAPASEKPLRQNRSIASKAIPQDNHSGESSQGVFWLMAFLGSVGGFFRLLNQGRSRL